MRLRAIIFSIMIISLLILTGCPFVSEDGVVTIRLRGTADLVGASFRYTVDEGSRAEDSPPLSSGTIPITGDVMIIPVNEGHHLIGDTTYTLDGFIDVDDSGGDPIGGIDYELKFPYQGIVDGDVTIELSYPDDFYLSVNGNAVLALYEDDECLNRIYGSKDLGTWYENLDLIREYTLKNIGTALLTLEGSPLIMISGGSSAAYTISAYPAETELAPGESTAFTFEVDTADTGSYSAVFTIPFHDSAADAFNTTISVTINEPAISLPKTGQTVSYAAGDDGDLELGVVWPEPRFTDNGDGTVTDNLSGLMWQGAPYYSTYSSSGFEWGYAVYNYVNARNNESYCGYDDWHLPNVNELMSLVHHGEGIISTWLNSNGFTGVRTDEYWTSTRTNYVSPTMGWVVSLSDGALFRQNISNYGSFAMMIIVREHTTGTISLPRTGKYNSSMSGDDGDLELGIPWPAERFLILDDGTVYDALTGLQWLQDPDTTARTWDDALTYANDLVFAGYDDWRMPNRHEMRSIVSYETSTSYSWVGRYFENDVDEDSFWWTSTTGAGQAWVLYLDNGNTDKHQKDALDLCWAVRAP